MKEKKEDENKVYKFLNEIMEELDQRDKEALKEMIKEEVSRTAKLYRNRELLFSLWKSTFISILLFIAFVLVPILVLIFLPLDVDVSVLFVLVIGVMVFMTFRFIYIYKKFLQMLK